MVDAGDSKSPAFAGVPVRVRPWVPRVSRGCAIASRGPFFFSTSSEVTPKPGNCIAADQLRRLSGSRFVGGEGEQHCGCEDYDRESSFHRDVPENEERRLPNTLCLATDPHPSRIDDSSQCSVVSQAEPAARTESFDQAQRTVRSVREADYRRLKTRLAGTSTVFACM